MSRQPKGYFKPLFRGSTSKAEEVEQLAQFDIGPPNALTTDYFETHRSPGGNDTGNDISNIEMNLHDRDTHRHLHRHKNIEKLKHSNEINLKDNSTAKKPGLIFINSNYNHTNTNEIANQQHKVNTTTPASSSSTSSGTSMGASNSFSSLIKNTVKRSESSGSMKTPTDQSFFEKTPKKLANNFITYSPPAAKQSGFRKLYNKTKQKKKLSIQSQDDKEDTVDLSTNFIPYTPPKEPASLQEPKTKTRPTLHLHIKPRSKNKKHSNEVNSIESPASVPSFPLRPMEAVLNFSKESATPTPSTYNISRPSSRATSTHNFSSSNNTPNSTGNASTFPQVTSTVTSSFPRNRSTSTSSSYLRQQNQFLDDSQTKITDVLDTSKLTYFENHFEDVEDSVTPIQTPNTIDEENLEVCSITTTSTKRLKTLRRSASNASVNSYSSSVMQTYTPSIPTSSQSFIASPMVTASSTNPFVNPTQSRLITAPSIGTRARMMSVSSNVSFQSMPQHQLFQPIAAPQLMHSNQQVHTVQKSPSLPSLVNNSVRSRQSSSSNAANYVSQSFQHFPPPQQIQSRSRSGSGYQSHQGTSHYSGMTHPLQQQSQGNGVRSSTPVESQNGTFTSRQSITPAKNLTSNVYPNHKGIGLDSYLSYIDEMKRTNGGVPFRGIANTAGCSAVPGGGVPSTYNPSTSMITSSIPSNSSNLYTSQESSLFSSSTTAFPLMSNTESAFQINSFEGKRCTGEYYDTSSHYVKDGNDSSELSMNIAMDYSVNDQLQSCFSAEVEREFTSNEYGTNQAQSNSEELRAFIISKQQQILRQQLHRDDPQVLSNVNSEDFEVKTDLQKSNDVQSSHGLQDLNNLINYHDIHTHYDQETENSNDLKDLEMLHGLNLQGFVTPGSADDDFPENHTTDQEKVKNVEMIKGNPSTRTDVDDFLMEELDQLINITRLEAIAKELEGE